MLPDTKRIRTTSQPYAAPADFCQIFSEDMSGLFLLALLLTADQQLAEQCFASALNDCRKSTRVFKNWAHAWARRAVIENAIRLSRPVPEETSTVRHQLSHPFAIPGHSEDERLIAVTALNTFERFAFVMSVLESYSDQECRILLGCFRHEVAEARDRAIEHIGKSAQTAFFGTEKVSRAAAAGATGKSSSLLEKSSHQLSIL